MENERVVDASKIAIDKAYINKNAINAQNEIINRISMQKSTSVLMQGIIWSEVLGQPVSKRKGRRHN